MSVAMLWAVSPNPEVSNCFGYLETMREGNRVLDSSKLISRDRNRMLSGRVKKGKPERWSSCSYNAEYGYWCLGSSVLESRSKVPVHLSMAVSLTGDMALTSEQKVYDVVLKQAALVRKQFRSDEEVKPGMILPGTLNVLSEAYDRCGEVCAEYAKTFYLGTLLMTPERWKAIRAIYALDRWESRLEDLFKGCPFDMLDASLSDTVTKFPVDIQPFKDMIEGMRMDLKKSRYKNFDELYLYCYRVAGTVGLMSVPVMGIAPDSQETTESICSAALALGLANQLTNILRDVGGRCKKRKGLSTKDELAQAGLSDEDIYARMVTDKWRNFVKKQIERARMFFNEAEKGVAELRAASRWPVWAALLLYRQILDEIEAND